jgi:acetoin utilization deacetylase AcuC-like enzyme
VTAGSLSPQAVRRLGLPWSPALVERSRASVQGTLSAARIALHDGLAANLAGGTHHAFPDRGEGYCLLNDIAIAVRCLQRDGWLQRAAVLDCDVHQGNGTAAILGDDPDVFTFSIHGANNFPLHKVAGTLDIALPDGSGDAEYLEALAPALAKILAEFRPGLLFYQAGVDPLAGDRFGRLGLTREGLRRRDRLVLEACREANVPVAITLGGGYHPDLEQTVEAHCDTVRIATALWRGSAAPAGEPEAGSGRTEGGP